MRTTDATSNSSTPLFNSLNEATIQLASLNRSVRAANALNAENGVHLSGTKDFKGLVDEDIKNFGQKWNTGWFLSQQI